MFLLKLYVIYLLSFSFLSLHNLQKNSTTSFSLNTSNLTDQTTTYHVQPPPVSLFLLFPLAVQTYLLLRSSKDLHNVPIATTNIFTVSLSFPFSLPTPSFSLVLPLPLHSLPCQFRPNTKWYEGVPNYTIGQPAWQTLIWPLGLAPRDGGEKNKSIIF